MHAVQAGVVLILIISGIDDYNEMTRYIRAVNSCVLIPSHISSCI